MTFSFSSFPGLEAVFRPCRKREGEKRKFWRRFPENPRTLYDRVDRKAVREEGVVGKENLNRILPWPLALFQKRWKKRLHNRSQKSENIVFSQQMELIFAYKYNYLVLGHDPQSSPKEVERGPLAVCGRGLPVYPLRLAGRVRVEVLVEDKVVLGTEREQRKSEEND